jgi:hypothetical protein
LLESCHRTRPNLRAAITDDADRAAVAIDVEVLRVPAPLAPATVEAPSETLARLLGDVSESYQAGAQCRVRMVEVLELTEAAGVF